MLHNVLVHVYPKTATTKIKTLINIVWKQLGQNSYQNASIWNARKGINIYKKSSMKYSLGYSVCSPGQQTNLQSVPPIALVLRPPHVWVRHSLLIFCSDQHRWVFCQYLNLKGFHSYSLQEQTYLLMKTFIQIFSLIFPKISGMAAALPSL